MLGKLIKHEWRETLSTGLVFLLVLVGITLLGGLASASMQYAIKTGQGGFGVALSTMLGGITMIFYALLLGGMGIAAMICIAVRFYKTMFSSRGYLTHTLPVDKGQLLFSKVLVSGIWVVLLYLGVFFSVLSLILFTALPNVDLPQLLEALNRVWGALVGDLESSDKLFLLLYFIILILTAIVAPFFAVCSIYGALTIGQLFGRGRVIISILAYMGISVLSGILNGMARSTLLYFADRFVKESTFVGITFYSVMTTAVSAVLGIILYMISLKIMKKKLNLL